MSADSKPAENPKTSKCRICCEPIDPAAKRCNACGTRLDRSDLMDQLSSASTVLAVFTALISVVTVGLPSLVQSLAPSKSNIHVAFVRSGSDYPARYKFDYQIYISNSGNRPGAIGKVWVGADGSRSNDNIELEIPEHYWPTDAEGIRKLEVLAPGESESLYFSRRQRDLQLPDKAVVTVNIIEFDGTTKRHLLPIPPNKAVNPSFGSGRF
jgi:hypothetical protein